MTLYVLSAVFLVSVASVSALLHAWLHAPEGREDAHGFTASRKATFSVRSVAPELHHEHPGAHRAA